VVPFPPSQHQSLDWMDLMHRQHTVHALVEVDVTDARRAIREQRAATGEGLSFTAFVVGAFARAIGEDTRMHAYRKGRRGLVLFDDVDVTVLVESDLEGAKIPVPHIVRAANRKSATSIHREIRDAQTGEVPYGGLRRWLPVWLLVPGVVRRLAWSRLLADPRRRKRLTGTAAVTAVGMFGRGAGWVVPLTDYSIALAVGSIARKPAVVADDTPGGTGERIAVREILSLTVSVDHDVIDGAPAARFTMRLKELLERGAGVATAAPPAEIRS
jgi:pyruvate/2-oxoglutarate dehydrogenase complex dihydrolipoamide acyltransferase (E2) component